MSFIKHIFVLAIMIAFTFNATAGFAAGDIGCDHPDSKVMEMHSHNMEAADLEQASSLDDREEEKKAAQCAMCKCGHCKTHSQMSLGNATPAPNAQTTQSVMASHTDIITSLIIYGIDNPPKHIS